MIPAQLAEFILNRLIFSSSVEAPNIFLFWLIFWKAVHVGQKAGKTVFDQHYGRMYDIPLPYGAILRVYVDGRRERHSLSWFDSPSEKAAGFTISYVRTRGITVRNALNWSEVYYDFPSS